MQNTPRLAGWKPRPGELVVGGGLGVDAGPGRLLFEGHYERGARELGTFYGTRQVHSNAFVISTGYRY